MHVCIVSLFATQTGGSKKKKESPRALRSKEGQEERPNVRECTGVWRAGETATVQADMYVKDYGTCSQRGVDQDPPPSYYLTGSCREHEGLCQREGGHTGQGAGKSDVTTEFSPVPNCMILSKTEGKSKPFKISPDSED